MYFGISLVCVFLLQFVYNTNSQLYPDSTATKDPYVAQNISKDSIICSEDCSVTCGTYQSCKDLAIKLSGSSTLTLVCNSTESCHSVKVNSTSMNSLNIDCLSSKACQYMKIYSEYIPTQVPTRVDIKINCLASHACHHALFSISHVSHVLLNCMSEGRNACANATLSTVLVSDVDILCGPYDCNNLTANVDTSLTVDVSCADSCLV